MTGMARCGQPDHGCADIAPACPDGTDPTIGDFKSQNLAVLNDVDAQTAGRPGVGPGDGVMTRNASARLQKSASDRKTGIGMKPADTTVRFRVIVEFGINPVEEHGVG